MFKRYCDLSGVEYKAVQIDSTMNIPDEVKERLGDSFLLDTGSQGKLFLFNKDGITEVHDGDYFVIPVFSSSDAEAKVYSPYKFHTLFRVDRGKHE